jgi:heme exporter protein A
VLTADDLACLRGDRLVFAGLGFRLAPGGALLLVGPNGSGKSSLLRLLAGLVRPFRGALSWDGRPVADDPDAHRARLAYVGHLDAVKPALTVQESLAFWAGMAGAPDPAAAAAAALERVGVGRLAETSGRLLSAGQKRRAALARLFVAHRPLWLLDEPTVALDRAAVAMLERAAAGHRAGGGMVVASTHADFDLPGADVLRLDDFAVDPLGDDPGAPDDAGETGGPGAAA